MDISERPHTAGSARPLPFGAFVAPVVVEGELNGIHVATTSSRDQKIPPHAHAEHLFMLIVEGATTEFLGCGEYHCGRGDVTLTEAETVHSGVWHRPGACFSVSVARPWLDAPELGLSAGRLKGGRMNSIVSEALWHAHAEFRQCTTVGTGLETQVVLALAAACRRETLTEPRVPAWHRRAVDYIRAAARRPIGLSQVAREVGVDAVTLAKSFSRNERMTVGEMIREERLRWGATQLSDGTRQISEIAAAAGFADHAHFIRHFRRRFGMTPSAFRRSARSV